MTLALSRTVGERIFIGDNIIVTVARINASHVVLGIDAPKEIRVHREEVYQAIQREQANKPPIPADAACDVRGLAGADYESTLIRRTLDTLDARHTLEDDQVLQRKMEDEQRGLPH
jgi:carbon storage regulator